MAKFKYFKDVKTTEQARKKYSSLAKLHHPDKGGDPDTMKEINQEYKDLLTVLEYQDLPVKKKFKLDLTDESKQEIKKAAGDLFQAAGKAVADSILRKI